MWLTVKEYAAKYNITEAAVFMRIKRGSILKNRIRRNDANRVEIKLRED